MRKLIRIAGFVCLLIMPSACASIISGTTQTISFNSNPPGADCEFVRDGLVIAAFRTPNGVVVEKTKHDIHVRCSKAGYQEATTVITSDIEGATFGNIILGGGIGWAIDSAAGADNKYAEAVTVSMVPELAVPTGDEIARRDEQFETSGIDSGATLGPEVAAAYSTNPEVATAPAIAAPGYFGAIAIGTTSKLRSGACINQATADLAESCALRECGSLCETRVVFNSGQCAAIAGHGGSPSVRRVTEVAVGETATAATEAAKSQCRSHPRRGRTYNDYCELLAPPSCNL